MQSASTGEGGTDRSSRFLWPSFFLPCGEPDSHLDKHLVAISAPPARSPARPEQTLRACVSCLGYGKSPAGAAEVSLGGKWKEGATSRAASTEPWASGSSLSTGLCWKTQSPHMSLPQSGAPGYDWKKAHSTLGLGGQSATFPPPALGVSFGSPSAVSLS